MANLPGGASALLVRGYKGKESDQLITRIDPGVVSPLTGLRGHGRRAAEDLGQWKTGVEERKPALLAGGDLLNAVCGSASPAPLSTRVLRSQ
jgi:hypothetical protein